MAETFGHGGQAAGNTSNGVFIGGGSGGFPGHGAGGAGTFNPVIWSNKILSAFYGYTVLSNIMDTIETLDGEEIAAIRDPKGRCWFRTKGLRDIAKHRWRGIYCQNTPKTFRVADNRKWAGLLLLCDNAAGYNSLRLGPP